MPTVSIDLFLGGEPRFPSVVESGSGLLVPRTRDAWPRRLEPLGDATTRIEAIKRVQEILFAPTKTGVQRRPGTAEQIADNANNPKRFAAAVTKIFTLHKEVSKKLDAARGAIGLPKTKVARNVPHLSRGHLFRLLLRSYSHVDGH